MKEKLQKKSQNERHHYLPRAKDRGCIPSKLKEGKYSYNKLYE